VAFTFSGSGKPFRNEIYGLLGLRADSPFLPVEVLDSEGKVYTFRAESKVNELVTDYDNLTEDKKLKVYYAALHLLAAYYYKFYFPNAVPKYMSDSRAVFDKFKSTNSNDMAEELIAIAIDLLEDVTGVEYSDFKIIDIAPPGTNIVTGG